MHALIEQLDPAIAVLLIEHDMDVAFSFAERITVLHQGRVLTAGTSRRGQRKPHGAGNLSRDSQRITAAV